MAYWLLKSEPGAWSWDDQVKAGVAEWDGVRNFQASANLKAMRRGDRAFFYHSVKDRSIVGIVEVVREYYPDPSDSSGRFGMVDVKAIEPVATPVSLPEMRDIPELKDFKLLRQSRLSVVPVEPEHWTFLCKMAGVKP